jgi:hypothetical protein
VEAHPSVPLQCQLVAFPVMRWGVGAENNEGLRAEGVWVGV